MTLLHSHYLYTLPVFAAFLAATLFFPRTYISTARAILILLRFLTIAAVVFAFAGPVAISGRPSDSLITLVDISDSVDDEVGDSLLSTAKQLARELDIPLAVIPFAKNAAPVQISDLNSFRELRSSWQQLDTGGTNIEKALLGGATYGTQSILLATDGHETDGRVQDAIIEGITARIFPLTVQREMSLTNRSRVEISHLSAPLTVMAQKSVDIRTSLKNPHSTPQPTNLTITHGKKVLLQRSITLAPNLEEVIVVPSDPSQEGLNEITAELSWVDATGPHTSVKKIWLSGEKRDKVLIVNGSLDDSRLLPTLLRSQSYTVQSWTVGESESEIASLSDYQAIVVNNTPRSSLPRQVERGLPGYVRQGGSLIMIGGNRSFGLGGYIGSDIEEILPVRLVPPTTEKKRLNLAVQLVIDKSRSMAVDNRLDYAKEAAAQVVRNLKDDDFIGVIGFDDTPFIAQPISQVGEVRSQVVDRVNRLFPNRRTELFPALDEARRGLTRVDAGRKHMIVLTDGKIPDAGEYYFQLVRQLKPLGITLSTIIVGNERDDGFLQNIATVGGGKHYASSDPKSLPSIFLSDIRVVTGERTIKESPVLSVRPGPDEITLTRLREFPILRGYVETLRRADAKTQLITFADQKGSPLLATISIGKGVSTAFTSDANGRWSSEWMRWSGISEFWSDVIDTGQKDKKDSKKRIPFDLRSWVERGEIVIDVAIFNDIEGQAVVGDIILPSGVEKSITFTSATPGHYTARIPNGLAGKYIAQLRVGSTSLAPVAWSLSGELFGERRMESPNVSLLSELAFKSGGKVAPTKDDLAPYIKSTTTIQSLSVPCLIIALLLFGIELVARELLRPWR